jgi:hypothetical protein
MTKLFNAAKYQGVAEEMIRKMFESRDVSLEFAIAFEIDVALHVAGRYDTNIGFLSR